MFDHYQAMVTAVTTKLRSVGRTSAQGEAIGGSTYSCDLWEGHPMYDEVMGFLAQCRERGSELVRRVDEYNARHPSDPENAMRWYAYVGQSVTSPRDESDEG